MKSCQNQKTSIAIVGGGIAGLGAAYELRRKFVLNKMPLHIDIYEEKSLLGGNADTVVVNLGESVKNHLSFIRWADLGVNDINLSAYTRIEKVMKEIGFHNEDVLGGPQGLRPLENTDCYFSSEDNGKNIVDDMDLKHGVTDLRYNLQHIDDGKLANAYKFVFKLANDRVKKHPNDYDYTVGDFFEGIKQTLKTRSANDEQNLLKSIAQAPEIKIDLTDPSLNDYIDRVRDQLFLPRIAAMYFTDDRGPEYLPLVSPMNYFNTQESKDKGKPKRRYFIGGSLTWIEALAANLTNENPHHDLVTIEIHRNKKVKATLKDDKFSITFANDSRSIHYDYGIIATHADHANKLLCFSEQQEATKKIIKNILSAVRYTQSYGICHTYSGIMPNNRNLWRSYNIDIREGKGTKPYNMSYLINRHQNDSHQTNSQQDFNKAGLPQYFVTLIDDVEKIPDNTILDIKAKHAVELSTILADQIPWSVLGKSSSERGGYRHTLSADFNDKYKNKAVTLFRHNVLNKNCLEAQDRLKQYHQTASRLYLTGGWTQGSGLQEECWQQAENIADIISSKRINSDTKKKLAAITLASPPTPA